MLLASALGTGLIVVVVLGIIVMVAVVLSRPGLAVPELFGEETEGLGGPIFKEGADDKKILGVSLAAGDVCWVIGPHGQEQMSVVALLDGNSQAMLDSPEFEAKAYLDPTYFSDTVAAKLGTNACWRLRDIRRKGEDWYQTGRSSFSYQTVRNSNRAWVDDEFYDDEFLLYDILDSLLFYECMFGGFSKPLDYYEGCVFNEASGNIESFNPSSDFQEEIVQQPWQENGGVAIEDVPAETTSQDDFDALRSPEDVQATPDPTPEPPAPEPERHYEAPPAYEPPDTSYDSGDSGSYDSGDSGGGSDD